MSFAWGKERFPKLSAADNAATISGVRPSASRASALAPREMRNEASAERS